jgi:hypothetical protein
VFREEKEQGFGSQSEWILIKLSPWTWIRIRIQVYKLQILKNFVTIFAKMSFLTFFLLKKNIIFTGPQYYVVRVRETKLLPKVA